MRARQMRSGRRTHRPVGGDRRRVRLAPTVAILLAACGTTSGVDGNEADGSTTTASPAGPTRTALPSGGTAATGTDRTPDKRPSTPLEHAVIVDLAVDWRPEGELDREDLAAQRQRIQAAENATVRALGAHGRVRRQLHASGQVALAVDDKGLSVLRDLNEVAAIHEDKPAPPAHDLPSHDGRTGH